MGPGRGAPHKPGGLGPAGRWHLSLASPRSKNLTWRDMQHLVVQTSKPAHLNANDWVTNGVGRKGSGVLGGGRGRRGGRRAALTLLLPQSATPTATGCWMPGPW